MSDDSPSPADDQLARWRRVPKVELHFHLDTSISFEVASALEPGMTHEQYLDEFQAPAKVGSLTNFLIRAFRQVALLQTEESLRMLTADVIPRLAEDGVAYAELRFAPLLHGEQGLTPEQAVRAVAETAISASAAAGIETGLILCALRHFDTEQSMATVRLVEQFAAEGLTVGFDLAGDEIGYPLTAHLPAFEHARRVGLPFTVHAGESGGPANVREVLDLLQPVRIGHGVRSIEEPALVDRLATLGTHLEVCPSCNVQTEVAPSYAEHPIARLRDAGVRLGISTDQRTITPISLSLEYARLHEHFGWAEAEFLQCNLDALEVCFAPAAVKDRVRARLLAGPTGSDRRQPA